MSIPYNQDIYAFVLQGGEITLQVQFQTWFGSGLEQPVSDAQLTIAPVGAGSAVLSTSSVTMVDEATFSYPWLQSHAIPAGDYLVWTANGPDGPPPIEYQLAVTVVPLPTPRRSRVSMRRWRNTEHGSTTS